MGRLYGLEVLLIRWGQVERKHNTVDMGEDALLIHPPILQNPASSLGS